MDEATFPRARAKASGSASETLARRRAKAVARGLRCDAAASRPSAAGDTEMGGVLDASQAAFEQPQLRRSQFNLSQVDWRRAVRLGGGLDGYVWRVHFGAQGPFALKVFYDNYPPKVHYYAFERECRNAALLQLMRAALTRAAAESTSIVTNSKPATVDDVRDNLLAFSNERRLVPSAVAETSKQVVSEMPPFTECFGWLEFSGRTLAEMPFRQMPPTYKADKLVRFFSPDKTYFAIVYEYVADAENDDQAVERVDRFLYRAGFGHTLSPDGSNWRHGKLVDHSEYVDQGGFGWSPRLYKPRSATRILARHT